MTETPFLIIILIQPSILSKRKPITLYSLSYSHPLHPPNNPRTKESHILITMPQPYHVYPIRQRVVKKSSHRTRESQNPSVNNRARYRGIEMMMMMMVSRELLVSCWYIVCVLLCLVCRVSCYHMTWGPIYNSFDQKYDELQPQDVMVDYINRVGLYLLDVCLTCLRHFCYIDRM